MGKGLGADFAKDAYKRSVKAALATIGTSLEQKAWLQVFRQDQRARLWFEIWQHTSVAFRKSAEAKQHWGAIKASLQDHREKGAGFYHSASEPSVRDALLPLLKNKDWRVSFAASEALAAAAAAGRRDQYGHEFPLVV